MDKYEYKVRADEIKDLIAQGEYVQAAEIADTIDWRRVKSVMMLCTISDLYKINRRYEDARNMLLLAYERRPGGRTICYSLCELSIKMEDFVPAVNYYKEFVQVAPKDPGRYILQYKLYEAQDVSLEERIGVLEELKKRDYREKWAYELAYLYHRVGLGTRCVEECDELILWFGEGKYVIKAMELKMLHQPLSASQQEKYDHRFDEKGQPYYESQRETTASRKQSYQESLQETVTQEQSYYGLSQGDAQQEPPYYGSPQGGAQQEPPYYGSPQGSTQQEPPYYGSPQGSTQQEPPYCGSPQGSTQQEQFYYESPQESTQQGQFYYETSQGGVPQEQFYYETSQEGAPQEQFYYESTEAGISREQSYHGTGQGTAFREQPYYGTGQGAASREQSYYGIGQTGASQEQFYYESSEEGVQQEPPYYGAGQGTGVQEQFYFESQQEDAPQGSPYYGTRQGVMPGEQSYYAQGQEPSSGYEMGGKTKIYESVSREQLSGGGMSENPGFPAETVRESMPESTDELDIQVKPVDLGKYNTINLQAEIAAGLKEVLEEDQKATRGDEITRAIVAPMMESETESLDLPEIEEVDEDDLEPEAEVMEDSEVFFGETGEIGDIQSGGKAAFSKEAAREIVPEIGSGRRTEPAEALYHHAVPESALEKETVEVTVFVDDTAVDPVKDTAEAENEKKPSGVGSAGQQWAEPAREEQGMKAAKDQSGADTTAEAVMKQLKRESEAKEQVLTAQPPKEIASVLSQESDGQIRLVIPESEQIEKQITGQMNLEDILKEWERMKQENAEKRKEEVRQHVLRHTGEMFTAFEAAVRDGLLEQLEGKAAEEQSASEETLTAKGNSVDREAAGGSIREEVVEQIPVEEPEEEYIEENEDWDSQEPEEDLEAILKEAEQEVAFGDADEAEETEEIEEAENAQDFYEFVEPEAEEEEYGPETYEAEEPGDETYEIEEAEELYYEADETEGAEEPETETYETEETEFDYETDEVEETLEAGEERTEEVGSGADETEEVMESEPETAEEPEPEVDEGKASEEDSGSEIDEPKESAAKKQQTGKAVKPAKQKPQMRKTEEAVKKKPGESEEQPPVEREKGKVRSLTREEKELYGPYIQSRASREQLVHAIDNISMAAYTGNIIITGDEGMDTVSLAKNMIREVQMTDSNFAGKVAKISGQALNKKDVETTVNQLASGALIIQKASGMDADTVKRLHRALQQESFGIIIILEDVKKAMTKFLEKYPKLAACFTARMDVESLSNGTLVAFGRKYAREREYSIDDMGILALHTRIDEMQTSDHVVTVLEVKELVDKAIQHANRKTLKHFFDILFARRYDEEDMIVLSERDFV